MAFITLHRGVCPEQRKAILVIADLLDGYLPAQHCVALRAIRTKFPQVDVSVAVGAILADVSEHRFGVTLDTSHFFMHAAQRVLRGVVVKLRNRANRAPRLRGMTIFTGNRQCTVRALAIAFLCRKDRDQQKQPSNEQGPNDSSYTRMRKTPPGPRLVPVKVESAELPRFSVENEVTDNCTVGQIVSLSYAGRFWCEAQRKGNLRKIMVKCPCRYRSHGMPRI